MCKTLKHSLTKRECYPPLDIQTQYMYNTTSAGDDVGAHFKHDNGRMSPRQLANHCVRMKCDDCGKTQGSLRVLGLMLAITDGLHLHHVLCVCDGSVTLTPCTVCM